MKPALVWLLQERLSSSHPRTHLKEKEEEKEEEEERVRGGGGGCDPHQLDTLLLLLPL